MHRALPKCHWHPWSSPLFGSWINVHKSGLLRLFFCVFAAFPALAQDTLLIENALLIDGSGAPPRRDAAILIENGRISDIGDSQSMALPAGAEVIDADGKTVIPGIVNLRGHIGLTSGLSQSRNYYTRDNILRQLAVYASFGVTTVASAGGDRELAAAIRDRIDGAEVRNAARVLTALQGFTSNKGYPSRVAGFTGLVHQADSARQAKRQVDELADSGVDFVHLWMDRLADGADGLDPKIYRAIIQRAKARGLPVSVQTPHLEDAKQLVKAGADILTQSITDRAVDPKFVDLLLKNKVTYAAALVAEQAVFEYGDRAEWIYDNFFKRSISNGIAPLLNGEVLMRQALDPDRSRRIFAFDQAKRNLKQLAAAGVRIGLGSGSGLAGRFEGYFEHREAQLMQEAGLSPLEVIRAFSVNAASALGIAADRGSISPGKRADFVILNANPIEDIRNLREIHAVFIGGRLARL